MKKNITFFGASVTEQNNGYVDYFKNKKDIMQNYTVHKYGYGSMHLKDAGIIYIDLVLDTKPQYCFLDWFETYFVPPKEILTEYLDTIVYKLFSNNCLPIFLLPYGDETILYPDRIRMYNDATDYAKEYNIPHISIYNHKQMQQYDTSTLLRDAVHTTEIGSKLYADIIYYQFINEIHGRFDLPNNPELEFPLYSPRTFPSKTRFHDIKKIDFSHDTIVLETINIHGKGKIIGLHQNIGPHSGLVEFSNGECKQKYNLWDVWCHYCRDNIKIEIEFDGELTIKILHDSFDTSSAKQQFEPVKKYIKPYVLYYIGKIDSLTYK